MNPDEKNNEPIISDDELKMPEEEFGNIGPDTGAHSHLGFVLATLIVVLILLLGGLYVWSTTLRAPEVTIDEEATRPTAEENNEPESTNAEADMETTGALSTSDELSAIEADLESTNTSDLDSDLTTIESELNASAQ